MKKIVLDTNIYISGDQHLLRTKEFKGIKIMKAREFLDEIIK